MDLAFKLGLSRSIARGPSTPSSPGSAALAALAGRQGFAIDFINDRMIINDAATPANAFDGPPQTKLTQHGTDTWEVDPLRGLNLSASRDFSIALDTALFPFNTNAIHVFARFELNTADSLEQRYLFMVDNTGNDRFALYTTSGAGFRWVTADGASADTELSALSLVAGTPYVMTFGADGNGRTWIDDGGIQTNDQLHNLATSDPGAVGIGSYPNQAFRVLDGYLAEIAVVCEDIAIERRLSLAPFPTLLGAEGDSHTFSLSLPEDEFYPNVIAQNRGWAVRNAGGSGESSAQILAQSDAFLSNGAPDYATIYAGSNDDDCIVESSPVPTATTFDVDDASLLTVDSWVRIDGNVRQVAAIAGNSLTLAVALPVAPTGGDTVEIATSENLIAWIQAVKSAGTANIYVIGSHYLNFPTNGDTPSVEQSLRAVCRTAQQAAASAESVQYVDTYAFMRQLILDGEVAQGDWAVWHVGPTDTHLTTAGEQVLAAAIEAAL